MPARPRTPRRELAAIRPPANTIAVRWPRPRHNPEQAVETPAHVATAANNRANICRKQLRALRAPACRKHRCSPLAAGPSNPQQSVVASTSKPLIVYGGGLVCSQSYSPRLPPHLPSAKAATAPTTCACRKQPRLLVSNQVAASPAHITTTTPTSILRMPRTTTLARLQSSREQPYRPWILPLVPSPEQSLHLQPVIPHSRG
jgi:hypothetical protein